MNKTVNVVVCSMLAVLFCLIISNVEVKANTITGINVSPANSDVYINSGSTWNQAMSSAGQNAQPSSAFNNYQYVTQFCATQGAWQAGFSIYSIDPSTFTGGYITINGAEYYCKYPCGFVNYYKDGVEIPNGYTAVSGSYPRSILYSNYGFGSGNVLWSAYFQPSQGENIVLCYFSTMSGNDVHFPDPLSSASYGYASRYYNGNYADGTPDFCYYTDSNGCKGYSVGTVSVPIFCDLNDAIYYMENGVILDNDHVLAGSDTAVVTPTPTPTATPIPQITGTVSIDGGTVNIGNFPTAVPTPTPIAPVEFSDDMNDGDISSGNGYVDSSLVNNIVPDISPGAYNFTQDETNALMEDGTLLPHAYLEDIMDGNGSIFSRYPIAAIDRLTDESQSQAQADDVAFTTYLLSTFYVFSDGRDSGGGIFGDFYFWFEAVIVTGILFIIVKKIIH